MEHNYVLTDNQLSKNEKKTVLVVVLTFVTMLFEIFYGYITGSMALLADGWHMGSHVGALGISVVVYKLARSEKFNDRLSFGAGKLIPLGGYTSALLLLIVAVFMIWESIDRLINPNPIQYNIAIVVAIVGLAVNAFSAYLLTDHDHHHDHHTHDHVHDHNHEGALMHVLADALTSVLAIIALLLGKYYSLSWADPVMGVIGALVITKWAFGLIKNTSYELLDGSADGILKENIEELFVKDYKVIVEDFHYWRIAPNAYACEILFKSEKPMGSSFYRTIIEKKYQVEHLIIEEQIV